MKAVIAPITIRSKILFLRIKRANQVNIGVKIDKRINDQRIKMFNREPIFRNLAATNPAIN